MSQTNCLAPLALVLQDVWGIEWGMMTTVHASTSSQPILDGFSKKNRRLGELFFLARRGLNLANSTYSARRSRHFEQHHPHVDRSCKSGPARAPRARGQVHWCEPFASSLPPLELTSLSSGISIRVPVNNVSMVDLTVSLTKGAATKEDLLLPLRKAAEGRLANVLCVSDDELVSSDFLGYPQSCIIDSEATVMLNPTTAKIIAWCADPPCEVPSSLTSLARNRYDNEWAYSLRILDLLVHMWRQDLLAAERGRGELPSSLDARLADLRRTAGGDIRSAL